MNNKCCKHNMMQKITGSHYVNNQEKMSLLPLKHLQNHIFNYSEAMSWSSSSPLLYISTSPITPLERILLLWEKVGNQSEHRIRFILPACRASHTINGLTHQQVATVCSSMPLAITRLGFKSLMRGPIFFLSQTHDK